jgi:hypothetical protein
LLEDNEKELAKKNISNLKIIRLLTEKCRQQEMQINDLEDKLNEARDLEASSQQTINDLEEKLFDIFIQTFYKLMLFYLFLLK